MDRIIIIGGGQAGASLAAKLRNLGHEGPVTLICGEPVPPYQRPPLSKAYLLGEMPKERLYLRPESFYAENRIELLLDTRATAIDPARRQVRLADDSLLDYDQLALTTGSHPRTLPAAIGGDLGNVFTIRDLADIDALEPTLADGKRGLVIGGGYIGLEAAAVLRKKGLAVTLIEMADRILQRVASPETSDYFRALHESHGVDVREGTGLNRLTGDTTVAGAELSDGSSLPVDVAVVGIGIAPATILADSAGLAVDNGITTDDRGRTSDPRIWAAGDCATLPFRGRRIRLESVQNAIDQAETVAANMLGADTPYDPRPWFWSDQYDCHLQIAGLSQGADSVHIRPGEKAGARSHWYYEGHTLRAVDAMNDPRAYMVGKRLIEMGKSPAPEEVANPETVLKTLLKS